MSIGLLLGTVKSCKEASRPPPTINNSPDPYYNTHFRLKGGVLNSLAISEVAASWPRTEVEAKRRSLV